MQLLSEKLHWRYAVKKYDPAKKIQDKDMLALKESVQLSPSSFGLQPYRVLFIEDMETREKLRTVSFNQPQITDASCLVVFAIENNIDEQYINNYFANLSAIRNIPLEGPLEAYRQSVQHRIRAKPAAEKQEWATRQAFVALGFLLYTAAIMGIDANPMEGFLPGAYDEVLGLNGKNLHSAVIAALGFRHPEDHFQQLKKVRKPAEELFINL